MRLKILLRIFVRNCKPNLFCCNIPAEFEAILVGMKYGRSANYISKMNPKEEESREWAEFEFVC